MEKKKWKVLNKYHLDGVFRSKVHHKNIWANFRCVCFYFVCFWHHQCDLIHWIIYSITNIVWQPIVYARLCIMYRINLSALWNWALVCKRQQIEIFHSLTLYENGYFPQISKLFFTGIDGYFVLVVKVAVKVFFCLLCHLWHIQTHIKFILGWAIFHFRIVSHFFEIARVCNMAIHFHIVLDIYIYMYK